MNPQQTSTHPIENMAGCLSESDLMNTDDLNTAKGGRFFLHNYTIDGFITWEIEHGSLSQELFEDFIEKKLLPMCNPFPGVCLVIVMDNAPIHQQEVH